MEEKQFPASGKRAIHLRAQNELFLKKRQIES